MSIFYTYNTNKSKTLSSRRQEYIISLMQREITTVLAGFMWGYLHWLVIWGPLTTLMPKEGNLFQSYQTMNRSRSHQKRPLCSITFFKVALQRLWSNWNHFNTLVQAKCQWRSIVCTVANTSRGFRLNQNFAARHAEGRGTAPHSSWVRTLLRWC